MLPSVTYFKSCLSDVQGKLGVSNQCILSFLLIVDTASCSGRHLLKSLLSASVNRYSFYWKVYVHVLFLSVFVPPPKITNDLIFNPGRRLSMFSALTSVRKSWQMDWKNQLLKGNFISVIKLTRHPSTSSWLACQCWLLTQMTSSELTQKKREHLWPAHSNSKLLTAIVSITIVHV